MKTRTILNVAIALALSCSLSRAGSAQTLPFEEKARYERALEQKIDDVLIRLLGPNQAKVIVETTMDFTRTEKLEVSREGSPKGDFRWQGAGGDAQTGDYLLPGFPAYAAGEAENRSYNRQTMSPSAFVKRMAVSVIINRNLPEAEVGSVRQVVSEMLMIDAARGDQLMVIKAPFAPLWRTVWYTPEALSMVLKYVILSLIAVVAMIVVAVGFLKLAGAMSTMAKVQQSHQITMDMGKMPGLSGPEAALPGVAGRPQPAAEGEPAGAGGEAPEFNVSLEQVPFLVSMMTSEEPANVALVAAQLPQEVKREFMKRLPPSFSSEVLINMAKIRFVDPEIIATLKDELERRLSGAVGGIEDALAAIDGVGLKGKMDVIEELSRKQPELAAEVRRRILLPDDLGKLAEREVSMLAGAIKTEEWANAIMELPEEFRTKLRAQMNERGWKMIEQIISYAAPSHEKKFEALEKIMETLGALIKEGKVANPATAQTMLDESKALA